MELGKLSEAFEAFVISGIGGIAKKKAEDKAAALRKDLRNRLRTSLGNTAFLLLSTLLTFILLQGLVTGRDDVVLQWAHYPELIQKYHAELVGWPSMVEFNPDKLSAGTLASVIELVVAEKCYWRKLDNLEYSTRISELRNAGKLPEFRKRAERKDKGSKRGENARQRASKGKSGKKNAQKPLSPETVDSDADEDGGTE